MSYILLKTTCEADLHMDDSFNELISKGGRVLDRRDVFDLMHGRSRMILDPRTLQGRDGARWVFTDQADIARTKREAP